LSFNFNFTEAKLVACIGKAGAEWYPLLAEVLPKYNINTSLRVAAFIAQCGHESSNFAVLEENLNYSADKLEQYFSKYFSKAGRNAAEYAKQPAKIANIVYANRNGNGDIASGDGFRFRGRGLIQLTGKSNYMDFGKAVNLTLDETIVYLSTKKGGLESSCWFWSTRKLNDLADAKNMIELTKRINGGTNGLQDRLTKYNTAITILSN